MRKIHDARCPRKNMLLLRLPRPVPNRSFSSFEKPMVFLGWILIGTGILCNEWVLTKLLSSDGNVEIQNRVAVWLFDLVFIVLGIFCMKIGKRLASRDVLRRLSQGYPKTCALSIGLVLTVLLGVCAEDIFYGLNYYRKEPTVQEEVKTIIDPILGYRLPPHARLTETKAVGGKVIYHATASTDAFGRRLTPVDHVEQRHRFLLFFGCSMTFGLGVNDDETMPFYVGQYATHYRPYNYGVSGYGPNHLLAQLQHRDLTKEIQETEGIAVYTFIDHHIPRVIGTMWLYNLWERHAPFYTLEAHDRLVHRGDFTSGRPLLSFLYWVLGKSQILQYYNINFPVRIREEHVRLTARIIAEARTAFQQQFPHAAFYVLLYPGVSRGPDLIPYLAQAGVKYLDYAHLIDWPHPEFTLADGAHPTAQGHRVVAAQLAKDLGIVDGIESGGDWLALP